MLLGNLDGDGDYWIGGGNDTWLRNPFDDTDGDGVSNVADN